MDFSKALEVLKTGKPVRRKGMLPISFEAGIMYTNYTKFRDYEYDELKSLRAEDILADDWEIIEESEVQLHTKPTLEDAILLAVNAHHGQKDKLGKEYILHPLWVMNHIEGDTLKIVAVLHDVVEDTNISLSNLSEVGYSPEIVEAIDAITKRPGEDRHAYLDRIMSNPLALQVKKVDTLHNTSDERMKCLPDVERKRLSEKYANDAEYIRSRIIPEYELKTKQTEDVTTERIRVREYLISGR